MVPGVVVLLKDVQTVVEMAAFEGPSIVLKDSECAVKPELRGAFDLLATDCSIYSLEYVRHYPVYNTTDSPNVPLEFSIPVEGSYYLDLKESFLVLQLRLTKSGTAIAATELTAPDSLCFHTMFEDCNVYFNDTLVAESSGLYQHQAYLDRLLKYSPDQKQYDLATEFLFDNDTPNVFTSADKGFAQRHELCKGSKLFTISGKPAIGLFDQNRMIFPGSNIRLQFKRAPIEKVLTSGIEIQDPSVYKLEIMKATFYAAKKIILKDIMDMHKKQVSLGKKFIYPYKENIMRSFTIAKGMTSFESDSLIIGKHSVLFIF